MSLLKFPLILSVALFNHVSTTPPVPPPKPGELLQDVPFGERVFVKTVRSITALAKVSRDLQLSL